jgi:hypothetical protein
VAVAKLLPLSPSPDTVYLLAPLACALASSVMVLTSTVHPPGGATAVLAVADSTVRELGWMLVPLIAIASCIMLCVACASGNVWGRRYPICWWSLGLTGEFWTTKNELEDGDVKRNVSVDSTMTASSELDKKNDIKSGSVVVSRFGLAMPSNLVLNEFESAVLKAIAAKLAELAEDADIV